MKQIEIKRHSADKKSVSVIVNGLTKGYRTMAINDDRKMMAVINFFKRKYNIKDKNIVYA